MRGSRVRIPSRPPFCFLTFQIYNPAKRTDFRGTNGGTDKYRAFLFSWSARNTPENGQAINDFDRATELNPKYAEAYNNRGNAYKLLDNQKQAISDYDRAIEISPNFAEAYYNRGIIYNRLGNQRQAI